jgi:hypothetical protein
VAPPTHDVRKVDIVRTFSEVGDIVQPGRVERGLEVVHGSLDIGVGPGRGFHGTRVVELDLVASLHGCSRRGDPGRTVPTEESAPGEPRPCSRGWSNTRCDGRLHMELGDC